jgi:hypothetical protein
VSRASIPVSFRSERPSEPAEVDAPAAVEPHTLELEPLALRLGPAVAAPAAPAGRVHDTLPRDEREERTVERAERASDGARRAWASDERRDLAVRHDASARHAAYGTVDEAMERRRHAVASHGT